ncbi:hypothetical protein [Schleiferilactobacillus shenzhenensis]|uniref:Uncharacterized protein n=1 Tax=Schleiferilactobacillus shenzhenensis LY-73 TaxID=1231336 RepID=U4TPL2_9LACO|nr:hypothetical protein [Schleiferilactobacillus shenzhenensis]ERL63813.1 hypothetical protein L248_2173 [Schleiferilactobacillus shenzhenensis LY-73]
MAKRTFSNRTLAQLQPSGEGLLAILSIMIIPAFFSTFYYQGDPADTAHHIGQWTFAGLLLLLVVTGALMLTARMVLHRRQQAGDAAAKTAMEKAKPSVQTLVRQQLIGIIIGIGAGVWLVFAIHDLIQPQTMMPRIDNIQTVAMLIVLLAWTIGGTISAHVQLKRWPK